MSTSRSAALIVGLPLVRTPVTQLRLREGWKGWITRQLQLKPLPPPPSGQQPHHHRPIPAAVLSLQLFYVQCVRCVYALCPETGAVLQLHSKLSHTTNLAQTCVCVFVCDTDGERGCVCCEFFAQRLGPTRMILGLPQQLYIYRHSLQKYNNSTVCAPGVGAQSILTRRKECRPDLVSLQRSTLV